MYLTIRIFRAAGAAALVATISLFAISAVPATAVAGGNWNDAAMNWRGYEDGMAEAKKAGKPICLVFYTDWCPHCTKYSDVFHDPKVIEMSKKFVVIRLNKDENTELSAKYGPDGQYIPRTYFLSPAGELDESIDAQRPTYKYFHETTNPAGLLRAMGAALEKHGTPAPS